MKKLTHLLAAIQVKEIIGERERDITAVECDSRRITPGALFVAVRGVSVDAHKFIPLVTLAGAAAIVCEELPERLDSTVTYIKVENSAVALGFLASQWWDNPSRKLKLVGVTGTNGKTTTVSLLGAIFKEAGKICHVAGNIGYPLSAAALESRYDDVVVAEVSSFQLETTSTFHPLTAAVLNVTEDHLNRHGTMEAYTALKRHIFDAQDRNDFAVLNYEDPACREMAEGLRGRVLFFSRLREVDQGAFVRDGQMILRLAGVEKVVCGIEEIRIPGPHNLENALAAAAIAFSRGVPAPVIRHALRTFAGVEHRIEFVRELDGVRYINDSKGTNVDSTIKAVQSMRVPTVIILGGYDKHVSFAPLAQEIAGTPLIRHCVLLGATAGQIEAALRAAGYSAIHGVKGLEEAVDTCRALSEPGGNVLFSPACASFDMFEDYEQRGRIFKEIVGRLH